MYSNIIYVMTTPVTDWIFVSSKSVYVKHKQECDLLEGMAFVKQLSFDWIIRGQ